MTQDANDIIQFEHVDHACKPSSKRIFTKRDAASKKQATLRDAISAKERRKIEVKTLVCQTEVEAEIHVEEEKAAEIKNNVRTVKHSLEAHQYQVVTSIGGGE